MLECFCDVTCDNKNIYRWLACKLIAVLVVRTTDFVMTAADFFFAQTVLKKKKTPRTNVKYIKR